ncbi:unnamed protein product, partial [Polarella glacialis]
ARPWLFKNYLERQRLQGVQLLQLSDVEDVAFQADPFVWVAGQQPGVHLFADEPSLTVGGDGKTAKLVELCYGSQVLQQLSGKPLLPPGFVIGTFSEVRQYMSLLVDEMAAHPSCHKKGVSGAINNFVAHGTHPGIQIHTYENRRGPVWTGANVPRSNVLADADNDLINEDGYKYAVLHQYDQHEELWKNLLKRFLKSRQQWNLVTCGAMTFRTSQPILRRNAASPASKTQAAGPSSFPPVGGIAG